MKRKWIIVLSLVVVLMAAAFTPLGADNKVTVTVKNRTGEIFWITFTGPETKLFQTIDGTNSLILNKGRYTYSYAACGEQVQGELNANQDAELVIKCGTTEAAAGEEKSAGVKITLNNKTDADIWMSFVGEFTYWHQALVGRTVVELPKGDYAYSYWACGQWNKGNLTVKDEKSIDIACGTALAEENVKFYNLTFNNLSDQSFWVVIEGDHYYWHQAYPGKTNLNLPKGDYVYTYTACGQRVTGKSLSLSKDTTLTVECAENKVVNITMENLTEDTLTLFLYGDYSYSFSLLKGKTAVVMQPGTYAVSAYGCDGERNQLTLTIDYGKVITWGCYGSLPNLESKYVQTQ